MVHIIQLILSIIGVLMIVFLAAILLFWLFVDLLACGDSEDDNKN